MKKKNNLLVKKVPLPAFIDTLIDLWNEGADYVDLESDEEDNERKDVLTITVQEEYINTGDFDEEPPSITENDLNELI